MFSVIEGPDATPFLHCSVELDPESFGLETDEERSKFYTTLDVTLEAVDGAGRPILSTTSSAYVELTPDQVNQVQSAPFAYQDDFPLLPGRYTVS